MTVDVPLAEPRTEATIQRGVVRALLRNPLTVAAFVVLIIFVLVAIFRDFLLPFPPGEVRLELTNAPPFESEYLLGGDRYGRDILSRLIYGTRLALICALIVAFVAALIGVVAGLLAGFFGKGIDAVSIWAFTILMAVPTIIVLISLYTLLGTSTIVAMTVFGILSSPSMFWMVRNMTRSVRDELYVDAARVSGLSNVRIIVVHVLAAIRAPLILLMAGLASAGIAAQAGLEFLGLGNTAEPSWGSMLTDAFTNIYIAPVQLVWPAVALGAFTGAFFLISFGVRDVVEGTQVRPSKRGRRRRIERLLGPAAVEKTLGIGVDPQHSGASHPQDDADADAPLLEIEGLQIAYARGDKGITTVVEGISLKVDEGEILGVVGESGSGKTQTMFAALGLLPDQAIVARGSIRLAGRELLGLSPSELRLVRGSQIAYIPQEPMANLDSTFTVGSQLVEGIRAHGGISKPEARDLALSMLDRVGIQNPLRTFKSYPHEISGGMAQRVLIAGAVATKPRLLLADEPTTALDVTIQAEVLDLLRDLQRETNMGVLIVTHNFGVVADLCDRVVVMRTGKIVEEGTTAQIFSDPQHEYTQMLLASVLDDAPARHDLDLAREESAHV
jgi:peptide/nickel transport system permease protein